MERGIWKNGLAKIFLTRSFLGPIFRPLLYSAEENIHYRFVETLTALTAQIVSLRDAVKSALAYYWLIEVPKALFEELFLTDGIFHIEFSKYTDGAELAFLTQGYVLCYLRNLLHNESEFASAFVLALRDLEQIINAASGMENKVFQYQKHFYTALQWSTEEKACGEAARLYVLNSISCLVNQEYADGFRTRESELVQLATSKCNWKLENAKYSTLTLLEKNQLPM